MSNHSGHMKPTKNSQSGSFRLRKSLTLLLLLHCWMLRAQSFPIPPDVVAWWPGENNTIDIVHGNNGTLTNGASYANGEVNKAFSFNGVNQYVKVPQSPSINSFSNQLTIEFWMYANPNNSMTSFQGLMETDYYGIEISAGTSGATGINLFIDTPAGEFLISAVNGGGIPVSSGQWHHIAGTYDGAKLQLYIDGTTAGNSIAATGNILPMLPASFLTIGSNDGRTYCGCFGSYFWGIIDEATLYSRALSINEISGIYNAGAAGKNLTNSIITQPVSQTVAAGSNAVFTVYASGMSPFTYQWWHGATNIFWATNSSLTLSNIQLSDVGIYYVMATNLQGSLTSSNAVLTVTNLAPYVVTQPQNRTILAGSSAPFSVIAGGSPLLNYRWQLNGTNIPDATNANLTVLNAQANNAGSYSVVITNLFGLTTSSNALLTVTNQVPFILVQPLGHTNLLGSSVSFSVTAGGGQPLSYQWLFNAANLLNATNSSLALTNLKIADAGNYSVRVTNVVGSVFSSNAVLAVTLPTPVLRLLNTNAMGGAPVIVPVLFAANGNENTLGFSLNFSTQRLAFASATWASNVNGALVLVNSNQISLGRIGFGITFPPGTSFAYGTQQVVSVTFNAFPVLGVSTVTATNTFGDQPVLRELYNAQLQAITASYSTGIVSLSPSIFESDVFPRTNGNQSITTADWAQMGRFIARLDTATGTEFQRADCAPKETSGDGQLKVTDWVQAGRYLAGNDLLSAVGGPTNEIAPIVNIYAGSRQLRLLNTNVIHGQSVIEPVILEAQGNETAVGFTLTYDPAALTFENATLGSGAASGSLTLNTSQIGTGKLGVVLLLPTGSTFTSGSKELIQASFMPSSNVAGSFQLTLTDQPVIRCVSDTAANELAVNCINNFITISPPNPFPTLEIQKLGTNALLRWPTWASDFTLQMSDMLTPPNTWTNLTVTLNTNGANVQLLLPMPAQEKFFRLMHP